MKSKDSKGTPEKIHTSMRYVKLKTQFGANIQQEKQVSFLVSLR